MVKEILAVAAGVAVGSAIVYAAYKIHNESKSAKTLEKKAEIEIAEKAKQIEKFNDLLSQQTYVDRLTANELTRWFKENKDQMPENAKMLIVTPTSSTMKGLGFSGEDDLDENTNVVQVFYDEKTGDALKLRLVNFTDIDTNLQAKLIENDGMIVITD